MSYDSMRQQFALHLQAPVRAVATQVFRTVFENRQLGDDIWMRQDGGQQATYGRLESRKAKDFKNEGGCNGPHNLVLRTCEISKKRASHCAVAEGKGRCVLRRG